MQTTMDYLWGLNGLLTGESEERVFGIVHIFTHILLHLSASAATKILESLLCALTSASQHDHHTPRHAARTEAHLLSWDVSIKGTDLQKTSGTICALPTINTGKPPDESFWLFFHRSELYP